VSKKYIEPSISITVGVVACDYGFHLIQQGIWYGWIFFILGCFLIGLNYWLGQKWVSEEIQKLKEKIKLKEKRITMTGK